ncbi:MAG: hypothetical protein WBQ29_03890, partial [Isosphaeraceae bacterium]
PGHPDQRPGRLFITVLSPPRRPSRGPGRSCGPGAGAGSGPGVSRHAGLSTDWRDEARARGGALAACLARREFSGSVASTAQTSSGQASGSKAKKPAHHSNHGAHQSPRRTAPHAAVTVRGRQVPAGPIRKPRARVRE